MIVDNEFFKYVIEAYGVEAQLAMLGEEGIEFAQSFLKWLYRDNKKLYWSMMRSEFADVIIMVEQLKLIFDMDKVDANIKGKIRRLRKRMQDSGYDPPYPFKDLIKK